jgi:hypothetical protein
VAVGDFNGDGKPDLAVANFNWPNPGTVSVLLGKGDGTFLPAQSFPAGKYPNSVAVGDFNGDGKPDLAVANHGDIYGNGQGVSVLLGQGDGTFQPAQSFPAGSYPQSVAVGDFNGDGFPDLAVANYAWVSILLNDATWPGGPGRARAGPSQPRVAQPLPAPAVLHLPGGGETRLAVSALLAGAPPPGNRPVIEPPAPLALARADPPRPTMLPVLFWEGRPSALSDPRAGPRARAAPGGALDRLFAELAANGVWDDRTDHGMPLLA